MRFTFPWPVKPWVQTQAWGIYNTAYQRFGFTRHNGNDVLLGADKLIRSPFAGTVIRPSTKENGLWQPNGGGVFLSVLSDELFLFDDGKTAHVFADFLHCDRLIQPEGEKVLTGTVLAVADNTGFSTGPHTHVQLRRCSVVPGGQYIVDGNNVHLEWLDQNEANNSFDPTPYFSKTYAADQTVTKQYGSWQAFWQAIVETIKGR
jgi:murein DD-endopeptidase MepM/ murein hydrolase activator NlpD